ncbi:aa3-type cytochrome c oxidase subunit IV, partial [Chryseobacterium sp. SIMBA_028]
MAEHHTGPVEVGAPMDYKEHEATYNTFIAA